MGESFLNATIWILVIELISFFTFPLLSILLGNLSDKGFAVSKLLGILLSGYIVWLFASIHLISFSRTSSVAITTAVLLLLSGIFGLYLWAKSRTPEQTEKLKKYPILTRFKDKLLQAEPFIHKSTLKKINKIIIVEEILFLAAFFFWVFVRGISPDIMGTEKFMDLGLMNAILKSPHFPPHDMWLSGYSLNYYYYGQYLFSFITNLTNIPTYFTYNFSIATIFALSLMLSISIVHTLTRKIWPSILAACILILAGNLKFMITVGSYYIAHHSLTGFSFWYPTSTRLIPFTINEFPIYSFIVADLHAHFTDIPVVLTSVAVSLNILFKKQFTKVDLLLSALIIGTSAATNSWDAFIYLSMLFVVLLLVYIIPRKTGDSEAHISFSRQWKAIKKRYTRAGKMTISQLLKLPLSKAFIMTGMTGVVGVFLFIPFYLSFKAPVDGIGINNISHSDILTLLVLFGFYLFVILSFSGCIVYLMKTNNRLKEKDVFVAYLLFLGILLIALPELFYLKDIFYKANPAYFRANTVFKLYYEAWIIFALATGYVCTRINGLLSAKDIFSKKRLSIVGWNIVFAMLLVCIFSYTYEALSEGYFNFTLTSNSYPGQQCLTIICFNPYKTDNGAAYITQQYADDAQMITWLNQHADPQAVIVEAVGDSYTYFARISANTGLATVLGWPNHEYQWRNTYTYSAQRSQDVQTLYTANTPAEAEDIVHKYNISYIVVGSQEKTKYVTIQDSILQQIGTIAFRSNASYIIYTGK